MTKQVLGHIDCPTCGKDDAMRVTADRNGDPFGFCEDGCGQQLRVGGKPGRVRAFVARYPWAAASPVPLPLQEPAPAKLPGTDTPPAAPEPVVIPVFAPKAPAPAKTPAKPVAKAPAPVAPPAPAKKAGWFTPIMGSSNG
jgi:hypothetical protein